MSINVFISSQKRGHFWSSGKHPAPVRCLGRHWPEYGKFMEMVGAWLDSGLTCPTCISLRGVPCPTPQCQAGWKESPAWLRNGEMELVQIASARLLYGERLYCSPACVVHWCEGPSIPPWWQRQGAQDSEDRLQGWLQVVEARPCQFSPGSHTVALSPGFPMDVMRWPSPPSPPLTGLSGGRAACAPAVHTRCPEGGVHRDRNAAKKAGYRDTLDAEKQKWFWNKKKDQRFMTIKQELIFKFLILQCFLVPDSLVSVLGYQSSFKNSHLFQICKCFLLFI